VARPEWRVPDVRLALVGAVFVLAWLAIGARLVDVQAVNAETYAEHGLDQRVKQEELPAVRGTIFDRDGVELAVSVGSVTVFTDPAFVTDAAAAAEVLSPLVGLSEEDIVAKMTANSRFAYIARRLERSEAERVREAVEAADISGIFFYDEPARVYPAGALASQVLGFVRYDDLQGIEGLEFQYNDVLEGTPGLQVVERDPYRNPIPQGQFVVEPPTHGADLVLTVDREIQFAAEQALLAAVQRTGAAAGSVVVIDVVTGEVLAMASAPTFDPNRRSGADPASFRNRAVSDMYEPGSTLKVVTVAAALEEAIVEPDTVMTLPAKYVIDLDPDPKVYTDVGRRREEEMSLADIVARSSNIGTIMIQDRLGNELHHRYLAAFGLGLEASGELPGEAAGLLRPVEEWCDTTCGPSTAIGDRVDVTLLQMASVFAAIGNDGVWVEPHLVREVVHADGSRSPVVPERRTVISPATAVTMQQLLQGVVESRRGTGSRAAVAGYTVGGKTGTTEKFLPELGVYSDEDRVASFIGIAPISSPRIVVAVMLDTPRGVDEEGDDLRFGGVSAAPVFAEVVEAALHRLGVAPDAG
jgi:cell division protein FtsI (penicillin-binding protein 3)